MSYVVYADVMLVWIFIINYLTYYITCKIANHRISTVKLVLWSMLAAVIQELFYINGIYHHSWLVEAIYVCLNFLLMIIFLRFIMHVKSSIGIVRLLTYNILGTLLLAGIIQIFSRDEPYLITLIPICIFICLIIPWVSSIFSIKARENICPIEIIIQDKAIKAYGFMDTGNTLLDTYSRKPVIILDYNLIKEILPSQDIKTLEKYIETGHYQHVSALTINGEMLHPIIYKTISNQVAVMPAFKIRELRINNKDVYHDLIAAISPNILSKNQEYMVLLNNNL